MYKKYTIANTAIKNPNHSIIVLLYFSKNQVIVYTPTEIINRGIGMNK